MGSERRRSPRIEILGRLQGHLVALDAPVTVREMSLGGMAIITAFPFERDTIHEFSLVLGDGARVDLRARAVHSRLEAGTDGRATFVTGFQFVDDEPTATVGDILNKLS